MGYQSKAFQSHAGSHLLLRLGAATAVLAIVSSGLWLSLARLTGVSTDLSQAVFVVTAGVWSLLALFTTRGSSLLVRGLAVCALSILSLWLVSQSAEPIFLWIVGILLCVHTCDAWLASRSHDPVGSITKSTVGGDRTMSGEVEAGQAPVATLASAPPRSQPRGNWLALLLVGGVFLVYMVIVPAVGQLIDANRKSEGFSQVLNELTFAESMRLHSVSGVVMAMFLAMGASIGSFLNVVIYRLPRRKALLWPPSSCSDCGSRIAGKDNIPILGWIRLGGKCRMCLAPLSIRYPLIEAIVGGMFVLFFYRELLTGGGNLPIRDPNMYRGIVWILLYTKWDLVGIYFFHMLVLTVLLAWGMVNWDLFRVPRFAVGLLVLIVLIIASTSPIFNPAQVHLGVPSLKFYSALTTSIAGCLVGLPCGFLLQFAFPIAGACAARFSRAEERDSNERTAAAPACHALVDKAVVDSEIWVQEDWQEPSDSQERGAEEAGHVGQVAPRLGVQASAPERYGSPSARPAATADAAASMALVGAAFGPPAAVAIMLLVSAAALAIILCGKVHRLKFPPVTLLIFVIAIMHLFAWRELDGLQPLWLPTASGSWVTFVCCALAGSLLLAGVGGARRLLSRANSEKHVALAAVGVSSEAMVAQSQGTSSESPHEEK